MYISDRRRRRSGWYAWLASLLAEVCREYHAGMETKEGAGLGHLLGLLRSRDVGCASII
jgi:hypothetical protein